MNYESAESWLRMFSMEFFNSSNARVKKLSPTVDAVIFQYSSLPRNTSNGNVIVAIAFKDRTAYKLLSIRPQDIESEDGHIETAEGWKWRKGEVNPMDEYHVSVTDSIYMRIHPDFSHTKNPLIRVQERFVVTMNGVPIGPMLDHGMSLKGKAFPDVFNRSQKFTKKKDADLAAKRFEDYYKTRMPELKMSRGVSKKKNRR